MGHRACLRVSRLLKWSIFTGCALRIRIIFMQNLVSVTWETQIFIFKAKLHLLTYCFICAVFDCLGAGILYFFGQFRRQLEVLCQNTPSWELFSKEKNRVPLSNFFSSSNMFFIRLFLANTWKKKEKNGGLRARLREKENLFRYRA